MTRIVGILVFDGVEVLDFTGPYETFAVANHLGSRDGRAGGGGLFEPLLVAQTTGLVAARYGFRVKPHYALGAHPDIDILIVPGGIVDDVRRAERVRDWIQRTSAASEITASVCTGAFLLGDAGLLSGLSATTHWEDLEALAEEFPDTEVVGDRTFVESGRILTSAGISSGIDMCLRITERICGDELAGKTARHMVYERRDR